VAAACWHGLLVDVMEGGLAWWVFTPRRMLEMNVVKCMSSSRVHVPGLPECTCDGGTMAERGQRMRMSSMSISKPAKAL
jgi:hypothetical protein